MKKPILSVVVILTTLLIILAIFLFTNANFSNERIIKVTSDEQIKFDMVQNGVITRGIETPYEFKFVEDEGYFIFKSNKDDEALQVKVKDELSDLSAESEIIVLTIKNDEITTFGMD